MSERLHRRHIEELARRYEKLADGPFGKKGPALSAEVRCGLRVAVQDLRLALRGIGPEPQ